MASKDIVDIPSELITEILYRLPSKSVGRFRCVSKEWLSLLTSPEFIKIHQNTLNRNYLFFSQSFMNGPYFIPFRYHEEAKEEEAFVPTKFQLQFHDGNPIIHASCNGLILLSTFRRFSGHETLVVSNPTTREFVELPDCDLKIEGHNSAFRIMCELGYDSVTDDYKVVTINVIGRDRIMCVHVYSLRSNTWTRVINYPDKYDMDCITSEALVHGSFHWVATNASDQVNVIVSFSLIGENFSEVASPTLGCCRLVDVDEKLAIFSMSEGGVVWLMNEYGVKGSWTKIKLHGLKQIPMLLIPSVFYVNGELLLVGACEMLIYDIEDGRLTKRIHTSGNTCLYLRASNFECICVESLVSPRFNRLNWRSTSSSEGIWVMILWLVCILELYFFS